MNHNLIQTLVYMFGHHTLNPKEKKRWDGKVGIFGAFFFVAKSFCLLDVF